MDIIQNGLVHHPYLDSINIVVNPDLQVMCCIICQVAILPDHISGHIAKVHPRVCIDDMKYCQVVADMKVPMTFPQSIIGGRYVKAYKGLMVHDGLACNFCSFACISNEWMQKHHHRMHPSIASPKQWSSCKMQQLNRGGNKTYWQVAGNNEEIHGHEEAIDRMEKEMEEATKVMLIPQEKRMISPWLMTTKWHEHVAGHDIGMLRKLVEIPKADDRKMPGLSKAVEAYFEHASTLLEVTDELILQRLNSSDPVKE